MVIHHKEFCIYLRRALYDLEREPLDETNYFRAFLKSGDMNKHTSFLGDIARLISGTVIAQIVSFAVTPVLVRLYAPEHFGIYAVFVSITGIVTIVVCLRYDYAILLPDDDSGAVNVFFVSLASVMIVSLLSLMILWLGGKHVFALLNAQELYPYLWLIPVAVFVNGLLLALRAWTSRSRNFNRISTATVAASLSTACFQLGLGLLGKLSSVSLIAAYVLGVVISTFVLGAYVLKNDYQLLLKYVDSDKMWKLAVHYRKFPLVDSWGAFFNNLSWQLPPLMLSIFFGQTVVGYYSLAYRLVQVPMSLVGTSIGQVFYQRTSELKSQAKPIASIVEVTFHRLALLGLLPALVFMLIGQEAFILVFGAKWGEAGAYVQILSLWTFFWFVSSPLSTVFTVMERQELFLLFTSANLITRFLALAIGGIFHNVNLALVLFAISGVGVYGGILLASLIVAQVNIASLLQKQRTNLIASFVGFVIIVIIVLLFSHDSIFVVFLIITGFIIGNWLYAFLPEIQKLNKRFHQSKATEGSVKWLDF